MQRFDCSNCVCGANKRSVCDTATRWQRVSMHSPTHTHTHTRNETQNNIVICAVCTASYVRCHVQYKYIFIARARIGPIVYRVIFVENCANAQQTIWPKNSIELASDFCYHVENTKAIRIILVGRISRMCGLFESLLFGAISSTTETHTRRTHRHTDTIQNRVQFFDEAFSISHKSSDTFIRFICHARSIATRLKIVHPKLAHFSIRQKCSPRMMSNTLLSLARTSYIAHWRCTSP